MLSSLARKIFGSSNDRLVRHLQKDVEKINALEPTLERLSDEELKGRTTWFRERLAGGETVDDLLVDAFATVREAAKRCMGMRHYDVQMIGGMVLHNGMIAEMRTGEGKTLVATLAAYLNALPGKGVHVVTVNDYLASRDAAWMGKLYNYLGLTVGVIVPGLSDTERKAAYECDIVYATNNELGFDYLRDNMRFDKEHMVQREFAYAIVDEVDSILIDEARTPLIISGPAEDSSELYRNVDAVIKNIAVEFVDIDEKARSANLTEEGVEEVERLLAEAGMLAEESGSLYDINNVALVHHVNQAVRAHYLFKKDVDYIIKDNKVVIIDEFTGRMMEGRRYSEGLHQALEAKEGVHIKEENQTLASITFQNYFRMYEKLAGMTGTAMTEAGEFMDIYKLNVVEIPTNLPVARVDEDDVIYKTADEKYKAVVELVKECYARRQPVLLGTVSIEKSEYLAQLLKKERIPHQVLNARYHEQEAAIIAQAGRPGAVTIATNMAGRGTDIMLGGNAQMRIEVECANIKDEQMRTKTAQMIEDEVEHGRRSVKAAGGLFVIATERHESRRIDNQLRGRSGRQGDPGATKFFLSLEDDLLRIFGADRMEGLLTKLGLEEGEAIFHPWMNRAIEKAQTRVEQRNYEIRKNLLKFDDVMNDQRKVIYDQRIHLMETDDVSDTIAEMREEVLDGLVHAHIPPKSYPETWDVEGLHSEIHRVFGLEVEVAEWAKEEGIAEEEIFERLREITAKQSAMKDERYGAELMRQAEKRILLQTLDQLWKDHLYQLDHLRHGINLRAYGQKDPLNEYKSEAFTLFEHLLHGLRELVVERLAHLTIHIEGSDGSIMPMQQNEQQWQETRNDPAMEGVADGDAAPQQTLPQMPVRSNVAAADRDPNNPETWGKVGRNEPCPCGSGKKFKHCHGALA